MSSNGSYSEWASGTAAAATGLGLVTFAIFPLAIPIVGLTVVALIPLALPLVAFAAIAGVLAGVWLSIRAVGRGIRRLGRRPAPSGVGTRPEAATAARSQEGRP